MILTITNNKAAADYLRGKAAMHPETFARLPAEIRARAFTIGAVTDVDLLRDLQDRVAELPESGDDRKNYLHTNGLGGWKNRLRRKGK